MMVMLCTSPILISWILVLRVNQCGSSTECEVKKKGILVVIFIKHNFDAISSYLVHSIDHKLRLFAREAWWYAGVGGL